MLDDIIPINMNQSYSTSTMSPEQLMQWEKVKQAELNCSSEIFKEEKNIMGKIMNIIYQISIVIVHSSINQIFMIVSSQ